jgi:hypothetical protein
MSASWSDDEDSGSAEWDGLCRVVKRLYRTTRDLFLRTLPSDPVYPDLADMMSQWNSDHGVHLTLSRVGEAWSVNLDVAEQRRLSVETLQLVATTLVRVGLFTGGTDLSTAYQLLYASVRPHVASGSLDSRTGALMTRMFGGCVFEDLTVAGLEADYLRANPIEVDNDDSVVEGAVPRFVAIPDPVEAVYLPGLVATLPEGFAGNAALQREVFDHIVACRAAIERSFERAGLGGLMPTQVDSLFAGTTMQQYVGVKLFGQYGTREEEGSNADMDEGSGAM